MQNFREENRTQLFIDNGADGAAVDIAAVNQNGGALASGSDILVTQTLPDGIKQASEIIRNGDIKSVTKKVASAAIPKYAVVAYTAGQLKYSATITVDGFGSTSFENQAFVPGWYAGEDGTSQAQIAAGIVTSLRLNLSKYEPVPTTPSYMPDAGFDGFYDTVANATAATLVAGDYFYVAETNLGYLAVDATFANATVIVSTDTGVSVVVNNPWFDVFNVAENVYVVEKPQAWAREKKPATKIMFSMVGVHYVDADTVVSETVTNTGGVSNPLSSYDVCDLEAAQYANFGEAYSESSFPNSYSRGYKGSVDTEYKVSYIISYAVNGKGVNYGTETPRQLFCVFASDPANAGPAQTFETAIETATGLTL